jgi:hypothetical protein
VAAAGVAVSSPTERAIAIPRVRNRARMQHPSASEPWISSNR